MMISKRVTLKLNCASSAIESIVRVRNKGTTSIQTRKVSNQDRVFSTGDGEREIEDYKKFISIKSALREPSITRQITALAYKVGKDFISLAEGMPNEQVFPFSRLAVTLKEGTEVVLEGAELSSALQYIPSQGLPSLLKQLNQFQVHLHDPPNWHNRDIIVTNGAQDGIYKCMELLLDSGDPILMQSPTYSGADSVLKPFSPEILPVPEDQDGILPSELEAILRTRKSQGLKMPKAFYLIPTGSNPSGTVVTNPRRRRIYELACEYDFIILEDDPYQFLCYEGEQPRSFLSMDTEGRVLRFDSLSKVLSSGLRLGWVTGPRQLVEVLELHMQASSLHSSTLTQVLVSKLFTAWGMEGMTSQLLEAREFYRRKRSSLTAALTSHLAGLAEWSEPRAGMFYWIKLKDVDDVYDMVVHKAFERGLMFIPGHAFTFDAKAACPHIRLTFSKATAEDMDTACRHLAELVREEQQRGRQRGAL